MKKLSEYIIDEEYNPEWDYVTEMASIGYPVLNKINYYIAVHGTNSGDRKRPHLHIYLENDVRPFNKFNFEIALDEIICYDEINLIRMTDKSHNIDRKNRNLCSWKGYNKLKNDFTDWLYSNDVEARGNFIDNIDAIIYFYNFESGGLKNKNPILEYLKNKGMKVHMNYYKYFSDYDKKKYKECF